MCVCVCISEFWLYENHNPPIAGGEDRKRFGHTFVGWTEPCERLCICGYQRDMSNVCEIDYML